MFNTECELIFSSTNNSVSDCHRVHIFSDLILLPSLSLVLDD